METALLLLFLSLSLHKDKVYFSSMRFQGALQIEIQFKFLWPVLRPVIPFHCQSRCSYAAENADSRQYCGILHTTPTPAAVKSWNLTHYTSTCRGLKAAHRAVEFYTEALPSAVCSCFDPASSHFVVFVCVVLFSYALQHSFMSPLKDQFDISSEFFHFVMQIHVRNSRAFI